MNNFKISLSNELHTQVLPISCTSSKVMKSGLLSQ